MTAIVGLAEGKHVWMGADSASFDTATYDARPIAPTKLFCRAGYVIGYAGSFRAGQILKHNVEYPDVSWLKSQEYSPEITEAFFVKYFVESVKHAFSVYGFQNTEEETSAFMVATGQALVTIEPDFNVSIYHGPAAVGTGAPYALGSLYTSAGAGLSAEARIRLALESAAEYNASVAPPFHIERT